MGKRVATGSDERALNAERVRALELLAAGQPVGHVARTLGRNKGTVYRWLENETFAAELDRMLEAAKYSALRILRGNAEAFASTIVEVAALGDPVGGRVQAAKDALDRLGLAPRQQLDLDVSGELSLAGKTDAELLALVSFA